MAVEFCAKGARTPSEPDLHAFAGFADSRGETGSFGSGFNPIILWKVDDRLFFEAELELELEDDETEVELEYAQLTYAVNDYLTDRRLGCEGTECSTPRFGDSGPGSFKSASGSSAAIWLAIVRRRIAPRR